MPLKLLKDEISKEMSAVQIFIELAIAAQAAGYLKAAEYFLSEAREDCEHAFLYARELDKHSGVENKKSIVDLTKDYYELEAGALTRIQAIKKEAYENGIFSIEPFMSKMMWKHSEDAYKAQKLHQNVSVLMKENAIVDIESLFTDLSEED